MNNKILGSTIVGVVFSVMTGIIAYGPDTPGNEIGAFVYIAFGVGYWGYHNSP